MGDIPLFIATADGTCRLSLRRFRFAETHEPPGAHRHDATIVIDEAAATTREPSGCRELRGDRVPHDDPRWPDRCACGEVFTAQDEWQCPEADWYEGTGGRFCWGIGHWDGLPGAMIRAPWRDYEGRPPAWTVFLPNRSHWNTNDRPAAAGNMLGSYWDVTGDAPRITVSPSIDDRDPSRPWHGWIRDGYLVNA
jgi:hypothetical protein